VLYSITFPFQLYPVETIYEQKYRWTVADENCMDFSVYPMERKNISEYLWRLIKCLGQHKHKGRLNNMAALFNLPNHLKLF